MSSAAPAVTQESSGREVCFCGEAEAYWRRSPEESTGNCELRNQRRRLEDPVLRRFSDQNKYRQRRKHWDEPEALFQIYGGTGGRNQRPQREREGWPSQIENKIDN